MARAHKSRLANVSAASLSSVAVCSGGRRAAREVGETEHLDRCLRATPEAHLLARLALAVASAGSQLQRDPRPAGRARRHDDARDVAQRVDARVRVRGTVGAVVARQRVLVAAQCEVLVLEHKVAPAVEVRWRHA